MHQINLDKDTSEAHLSRTISYLSTFFYKVFFTIVNTKKVLVHETT